MIEFINAGKGDFKALGSVIEQEPLIASKVLKYANSALYGNCQPSSTIDRCITRLGTKTVADICMALCLRKRFGDGLTHYPMTGSGYWKHSLIVGALAKDIVSSLSITSVETSEIYLAGLLHDIGKLVLDEILTANIEQYGQAGSDTETSLIGITHAETGVKIARKWNLPPYIESVIANHHDIDPACEYAECTAVIKLADLAAICLLETEEGNLDLLEDEIEACKTTVLPVLNTSAEWIDHFLAQTLERSDEMELVCSQLN